MHGTDGGSSAAQSALQLHEAAGIDGHDGIGAGARNRVYFSSRHGAGDIGELDREGSTEAAAFLGRIHFGEAKTANGSQQAARGVLDFELAKGVATIVVGDDPIKFRADVF